MDEEFSWRDTADLFLALCGLGLAVFDLLEERWAHVVFWFLFSLTFGLTVVWRHAEALGVSRLRSRFRRSIGLEIVFNSVVIVVSGVLLVFTFELGWPAVLFVLIGLGVVEGCYLVSVFMRRRLSGGAEE